MVSKPLRKDDPPKLPLRKKDFTKRNSSRRKLELVEDVVFLLVSFDFLSRRKNRTIKRG